MGLSEEERKEQIRKSDRLYYQRNKSKVSKKQKAYYEKNKDKLKAKNNKYYHENKDKCLAKQKEYVQKNKDAIHVSKVNYYRKNKTKENHRAELWIINNREKHLARVRKSNRKKIVELDDHYIKGLLLKHSDLKYKDIPQELVDFKRAQMKLRRTIKEIQKCKT